MRRSVKAGQASGTSRPAQVAARFACAMALCAMVLPVDGFWIELQRFHDEDPEEYGRFGSSIAIEDDTAVVGVPSDSSATVSACGSVVVFTRSGGTWSKQARLFADDAAERDAFGSSVAISGETIVVGAPHEDDSGVSAGSAYVFVRSGGVWSQQGHLYADDGTAGDYFGASSVAISGDTILVGVGYDDTSAGTDAGSVYVFTRSGGVWSQQDHLYADDAAANDWFGNPVAISGDTFVAGAQQEGSTASSFEGSAYVFVRSAGVWSQQGHLYADDGVPGDRLGKAVAIEGDTVVVGCPYDDTSAGLDAGSAYVFTRSAGVWSQQAHLRADLGALSDRFGSAVAIDGDTLVVGAPENDDKDDEAGKVYVFMGGAGGWSLQSHLYAHGAGADDQFGNPVTISGETIMVGVKLEDSSNEDDAGSVHVLVPQDFRVYRLDPPGLLTSW